MAELLSLVSLVISVLAIFLSLAAIKKASKSGGAGSAKKGPTHADILADAGRAELSVALVKHPSATGSGKVSQDFRIWITNDSNTVPAFNVRLEIDLDVAILYEDDYNAKIPYRELNPGKSLELQTAIGLGTPKQFVARVIWQNPNGTEESEEYLLDRSA